MNPSHSTRLLGSQHRRALALRIAQARQVTRQILAALTTPARTTRRRVS
jgi:hypothetical protein